jgi:hypothetical protein
MRTYIGTALLIFVIAPCGAFGKEPPLLSLSMEHFRDSASVAHDPAKGLTTISTEPGYAEHSGLMGMVWHDEFLTAVIDAQNGRTSYQIDVSITYSGARRSYVAADLTGMTGLGAIAVVKTESANCATGECMYTDHLVIPVEEALLRQVASAYVPGKPIGLTYKVIAKGSAVYRGELSNAEIAGLLAKVDRYEAAPAAPSAAPQTPRRLDFGISGVVVSASTEMPERAGVLVAGVDSGSVAQQAGIITGDIIFRIDDRPTHSLADLEGAVAAMEPHATATVRLYRGLTEISLKARF